MKFLGVYVVVSVITTLLILLSVFPHHPHTLVGWFLLFVAAAPITIVGELVGDFAFHNRLADSIEARSENVAFWFLRFIYVFIAVVLMLVFGWAVVRWAPPL